MSEQTTPSTIMFKIGNTDYSTYVIKRKHKVNDTKEINTWTDANHKTHSDLIRTRATGSITLSFFSATDYNNFVSVVNSAQGNDGKFAVTVYVNNRNTSVTMNAFLTFSVKTAFQSSDYGGEPAMFQVDIKLEEE